LGDHIRNLGWEPRLERDRRLLVELEAEEPMVDVVADVDQRLPVGVAQEASDTEVAGVVDRGFGSERAAFFEVLLDLRGAEVNLDRSLGPAVEDLGMRPARDASIDAPAEDDPGLIGETERELVGERLLKPGRPAARWSNARVSEMSSCRNARARPYPRRRSSSVSAEGSVACQRSKNVTGGHAVTDLSACGSSQDANRVIQRSESDAMAMLGRLLFGPLVPVQLEPDRPCA
jgi:hypothetical protein